MFVHDPDRARALPVKIVSAWLGIGNGDWNGRALMILVAKSTEIATAIYHADDRDHDLQPLASQPLSPVYEHHNHIHIHFRSHSHLCLRLYSAWL